jgi:hypothetical protein
MALPESRAVPDPLPALSVPSIVASGRAHRLFSSAAVPPYVEADDSFTALLGAHCVDVIEPAPNIRSDGFAVLEPGPSTGHSKVDSGRAGGRYQSSNGYFSLHWSKLPLTLGVINPPVVLPLTDRERQGACIVAGLRTSR